LWPKIASKSFFISHCAINGPYVSARQIFCGGCAISRSTTSERAAVASSSSVHPVQQGVEAIDRSRQKALKSSVGAMGIKTHN
jgi:hypothetical protein